MNMSNPELLVVTGQLAGRRFAVSETGLRLGRSSSCEISISDLSLSRNHCLFELREGALWVTDLASANGTLVNGKEVGSDSVRLAPGDVVTTGDTELRVVEEADGENGAGEAPPVDLGLGREEDAAADDAGEEAQAAPRPNMMRRSSPPFLSRRTARMPSEFFSAGSAPGAAISSGVTRFSSL